MISFQQPKEMKVDYILVSVNFSCRFIRIISSYSHHHQVFVILIYEFEFVSYLCPVFQILSYYDLRQKAF